MNKKRLIILSTLFLAILGCFKDKTVSVTDTLVVRDTLHLAPYDTLYSFDTVWMADSSKDGLGKLTYAGSRSCDSCHPAVFRKFSESGHAFALNRVEKDSAPGYPKFVFPPLQPPAGKGWKDISYVVGGYKWKAVFLDTSGYVHTAGGKNQFNLADTSLSDFLKDSASVKFVCGQCHTTGYRLDSVSQNSMAGLAGTWSEPGVQCEACHGRGSHHVESEGVVPMRVDRSARACGKCHSNGDLSAIPVHNGFILPNAQYNELLQGKKASMACVDCHDPHASTVYNDAKGEGIHTDCRTCHQAETENMNTGTGHSTNLMCPDCHMPKIGKSAINRAKLWGDLSSHLFRINTDTIADQFDFMKVKSKPYVNLEYGCLKCHGDSGVPHPTFTMHERTDLMGKGKSWAATFARSIHRNIERGKDYYMGAAVCMTCHGPQLWDSSAHGQNFREKLVSGQDVIHGFEGSCQPCHVTGYGSPSGWGNFSSLHKPSTEDSLRLEGVQCEACHEPASRHVLSGEKKDIRWDVDYKKTCVRCHVGTFDQLSSGALGPADSAEVEHLEGARTRLSYGLKGYEYPGSVYSHTRHLSGLSNGCVTCHMAPDTDHPHDLKPDQEACYACHEDYKNTDTVVFGDTLFFNYRGVQGTVTGLLARLDTLVNLRAFTATVSPADTASVKSAFPWKAASYNLNTIKADKSRGLHDYPYIKKLLEDAIADSGRYLNLLP